MTATTQNKNSEIIQAAKAVYDKVQVDIKAVVNELESKFDEAIDKKLASMRTLYEEEFSKLDQQSSSRLSSYERKSLDNQANFVMKIAGDVDKRIDKKFERESDSLRHHYESTFPERLDRLLNDKSISIQRQCETNLTLHAKSIKEDMVKDFNVRIKAMGEHYNDELHSRVVSEIYDKVEAWFEEKSSRLQETFQAGIDQIKALLEAMPTPQVMLPPDSIHVSVENKTLLEMPKRTTTSEKSVVYSEITGRPERIIEKTTED